MNLMQQPPTLTDCDREPIHNIGMIQSFGAFLKLNADWAVAHCSANCGSILGLDRGIEIGSNLNDAFTPRAIAELRACLSRIYADDQVERAFGLTLTSGGGLFDCAVHQVGERVIIEFEPHAKESYDSHISMIGPMLASLDPIKEVGALCEHAAQVVREKLGYDRVMIYKFHPDDTGEVIAERKRDDLDTFLGLRYPRSDIPHQARELFKRNKFRVIADVDDNLIPVLPERALGGRPLDMSLSALRASSSIHLEYLRNMGVGASLTIAIVRQDKLWGLISCHHCSPKLPPYSLRTVAELFSMAFSLILDRILITQSERMREQSRKMHDQLMLRLAGGNSLAESLPMLERVLQDAVQHDGASILVGDQYSARGSAPTQSEFMALAPTLGSAPVSTIISSSAIAEEAPAAHAFAERAAGALIIPISRSPRDYLVLWRKPLAQTVVWAGNPEKAVLPGETRLMPRSSFAAWQQDIEGRSDDWTADELQIAEALRVTLLEIILRMTDEASRERARAQEKQELLISELNHRVRNILNLIRSLVSQSQHDALSVAGFAEIIGGRISALASAHDNITRENWAPAPLSALFETELAAYLNEKRERFNICGDEVLVKPEAYTVLALVAHELVTNSAKYGSLCDRTGQLDVTFERNDFGDLKILWRERGGPPVKPPTRRGFGSTIIERSIPYELKGEANLRFKLSGLEADFLVPQRYIVSVSQSVPSAGNQPSIEDARAEQALLAAARDQLPGHVLLVEDSMIIALDTEENLKQLGVSSIDLASSVGGALAAIERHVPDFAIVDFNLGAESSEPVARELKKRGVRFVLATGYAEMEDQIEQLGADALLRKPYGLSEIETTLHKWNEG